MKPQEEVVPLSLQNKFFFNCRKTKKRELACNGT